MLSYFLGPYQFHGEWGAPQFTQMKIAGETRPGVNGTSLQGLGTWGVPFEIDTITFCQNWVTAISLCQSYQLATAMNPLILTIGSVIIPGGTYQVLGVDAKPKAVLRAKIAGDSTVYQAEVRARWSLLPLADDI